jgi:hypothetical protein
MNRSFLRVTLIGLVLLVALAGLAKALGFEISVSSKPSPSSSATYRDGTCDRTDSGVTVVVDFGSSSSRTSLIRCVANGTGLSGWQLFEAAGIRVEGTSQYPSGFVCRVAGWPSVKNQPCTSTPTLAQGSWAYFRSSLDQPGWHFALVGAGTTKPACGQTEGWRFVTASEASGGANVGYPEPRFKPVNFKCAQ